MKKKSDSENERLRIKNEVLEIVKVNPGITSVAIAKRLSITRAWAAAILREYEDLDRVAKVKRGGRAGGNIWYFNSCRKN